MGKGVAQPWGGGSGAVARRHQRKNWPVAAAASAPALPAAARAAAPAAAHLVMSPVATPAVGSPAPCVGRAQTGAPAGALKATHATPWPLRVVLPALAGALVAQGATVFDAPTGRCARRACRHSVCTAQYTHGAQTAS